ncbi:MAG: HAD family phosphatase [Myxococcota bacterium]|nr:HAD family phosphatase [Myxococcota bacterium]
MSAYDAVLFDYGGVFTSSPFAAVESRGAELGADPRVLLDTIFGPYHADTDHPWHCLERGEIALSVAVEAIIELGVERGVDADPFKFFSAMAVGGINQTVVECTRGLRNDGIKTALVTNNAAEFRKSWRDSIPVDELFDVVVDSSEEGVRKPDPRIFELTLARLGVEAVRSVFLDDFAGNVTAAESLGITGILVGSDQAQAVAELETLLGRSE